MTPSRKTRSLASLVQYAVLPIGLLAGWEALYRAGLIQGYSVTAPSLVLAELAQLTVPSADYGSLLVHIRSSLGLVLIGLSMAVVIGIPTGLAMAANPVLRRAFMPVLYVVRPLPPIALLPLAVALLGLGNISRVALVCAASWPTLTFTTFQAARSTNLVLLDAGRSLGANRFQILTTIVVPASLPGMLTGFRVSASLSFMTIVAAELLGATEGLGYLLSLGARNFDITLICAALVVIAGVGLLMDRILWAVQHWLVSWESVDANV